VINTKRLSLSHVGVVVDNGAIIYKELHSWHWPTPSDFLASALTAN